VATDYFINEQGRLAYSDEGFGPLVVCVPGLGDLRQEYRYLAPWLVEAGFRVCTLDLRGHGDSSTRWADLSPRAIGRDILALIRHLGADRAIVIGTSMAAGAAVWAAAEEPDRIAGIVLIGPFVRDVGSPAQQRLYRMLFRLVLARPWGLTFWMRYWASLFPAQKPSDFEGYRAQLRENLSEPGRFEALRRMMLGESRREIEARLSQVEAPALVVMGTNDRDFKDPSAEAQLVADQLRARVELIDDAGHYPHVEFPARTSPAVILFAKNCREPRPKVDRKPHSRAAKVRSTRR
jgi:pimeloyl-ACP methyl ester carboxylesterase